MTRTSSATFPARGCATALKLLQIGGCEQAKAGDGFFAQSADRVVLLDEARNDGRREETIAFREDGEATDTSPGRRRRKAAEWFPPRVVL